MKVENRGFLGHGPFQPSTFFFLLNPILTVTDPLEISMSAIIQYGGPDLTYSTVLYDLMSPPVRVRIAGQKMQANLEGWRHFGRTVYPIMSF